MNNRTIKTTVENMVKGLEITRRCCINAAKHEYKQYGEDRAKVTVDRYNKQFRDASGIASSLCIIAVDNYSENMRKFLDDMQDKLNSFYVSLIDDVIYEVDHEEEE